MRCLGVVASGDKVIIVDADVPETGPIEVLSDATIKLQNGAKPAAYCLMHQRISDYVRENGIKVAFLKASAVSQQGKPTLAHFESAELRGVTASALHNGGASVNLVPIARVSKTFGERKAKEYLADDKFWEENAIGNLLRGGSREAAILLLASQKK